MQTNTVDNINTTQEYNPPLVHKLEDNKRPFPKFILIPIALICTGIVSGYMLSRLTGGGSGKGNTVQNEKNTAGPNDQKRNTANDSKIFPDSAQGELEVNDSKMEGSFKLIRPGGESQTVYLTSSSLDLNQYVGKNVKVWGETFSAKKAGWLMDVGKIEVLQ